MAGRENKRQTVHSSSRIFLSSESRGTRRRSRTAQIGVVMRPVHSDGRQELSAAQSKVDDGGRNCGQQVPRTSEDKQQDSARVCDVISNEGAWWEIWPNSDAHNGFEEHRKCRIDRRLCKRRKSRVGSADKTCKHPLPGDHSNTDDRKGTYDV